jgi:hypothetical protein
MPDQKLRELCLKISTEQDSEKLIQLVEELNKLLAGEQDVIKTKIRSRFSKGIAAAD